MVDDIGSKNEAEGRKLYELIQSGLRGRLQESSGPVRIFLPALASDLSVSRDPVQRALSQLETEGLLERQGPARYVTRGARPVADTPIEELLPPATLEAIQDRTSWQRIYRDAEQTIASLMPFGTYRLTESAMAEHFGVSRTITTAVISRLEERGIVRRGERGRWQVAQLTALELQHIYELRELLEPAAMVDSVPRLPAGTIQAALQRVMAAEATNDIDQTELQIMENDLHVAALAECQNRRLLEMIARNQVLWIALDNYLRTYPLLPSDLPYLREHRLVLEHLSMGNCEVAAEALKSHLRISFQRAKRRIELVSSFEAPPLPVFLSPARS